MSGLQEIHTMEFCRFLFYSNKHIMLTVSMIEFMFLEINHIVPDYFTIRFLLLVSISSEMDLVTVVNEQTYP